MKYLRSINENNNEDIKEKIKECFLDLTDFDFEIKILIMAAYGEIIIRKKGYGIKKGWFKYNDVKETILFAIPFLTGECNITFNDVKFTQREYDSETSVEQLLDDYKSCRFHDKDDSDWRSKSFPENRDADIHTIKIIFWI